MKMILLYSSVFINLSIMAQKNNEPLLNYEISPFVGIALNQNLSVRYGLFFRKDLEKLYNLQFAGFYNKTNEKSNFNVEPLFSSDSLVILRKTEGYLHNYLFKIGLDKTIYSIFFVGSNFNIGYASNNVVTNDQGIYLNQETQEWRNCNECVYAYHNIEPNTTYEMDASQSSAFPNYTQINKIDDYMIFGFSLNIGIRVPINKKLRLDLQYSPELWKYKSLNQGNSLKKHHHFIDLMLAYKF